MKSRSFLTVAMTVFLIVGVVHLWRALTGTAVMFGQTSIPIWASWVAAVFALYLSYSAYKLRS